MGININGKLIAVGLDQAKIMLDQLNEVSNQDEFI